MVEGGKAPAKKSQALIGKGNVYGGTGVHMGSLYNFFLNPLIKYLLCLELT